MKPRNILLLLLFVIVLKFGAVCPSVAAPPVRIAVVPSGGSGMEQDIVDGISSQLAGYANIVLSTVNPDWFVVCSIVDKVDVGAATVRVNGTVTIKTTDGHVLNTISMQTNKQDFSLSPGTPLNKELVNKAVREVLQGLTTRAIGPIQAAVDIEMQTREKVIRAQTLADEDKYDEALSLLMTISPDTPHFKGARSLIAEFQMEQEAKELVKQAQLLAQRKRYRQAINLLTEVDQRSKRYKIAKALSAAYQALMRRSNRLTKVKSMANFSTRLLQGKLSRYYEIQNSYDNKRFVIMYLTV